MKNLTDNQQQIVDSIISEFYKINDDNQHMVKGKLIDFSGIISQQQEDLKTKAQIEAQNKVYDKMLSDTVVQHMAILNEDLYHLGLWAHYTYNNDSYKQDISIGILGRSAPGRGSISEAMRLTYHLSDGKSTSFKSGISSVIQYSSKFGIGLRVVEYGNKSFYNSLESLVESDSFKWKLKELYNKSN